MVLILSDIDAFQLTQIGILMSYLLHQKEQALFDLHNLYEGDQP